MIQRSVRLACSPEKAFALFTERISDWWPKERRHTKDPNSQLFLAPTGRFWERASDGHEVELGAVLAWEPPKRLLLDFYVGTSQEKPTQAEILFIPDEDGTRVLITHQPTPRSQDLWSQRAPLFTRSWQSVLQALLDASTSTP